MLKLRQKLRQWKFLTLVLVITFLGLLNIYVSLNCMNSGRSVTLVHFYKEELQIGGEFLSKHLSSNDTGFVDRNETIRPLLRRNRYDAITLEKALERNLVRATTCNGCFEHNFNRLLNYPNICSGNTLVELLILITSSHSCQTCRDAIRQTWLQESKNNTSTVRYVFLLGVTADDKLMAEVLTESRLHRDILVEDFVDTYYNLTYKTVMGLKWATEFCSHAKYVLKTDDDVFINVQNVLKLTQNKQSNLQKNIVGSCSLWRRPLRNQDSKWYVSRETYPWTFLPPFCSGTGYVMSIDVAQHVLKVSRNVPYFHLEDVYVGLCLIQLRFSVTDMKGFNRDIHNCVFKDSEEITMHFMDPVRLKKVWNEGKFCFEQSSEMN